MTSCWQWTQPVLINIWQIGHLKYTSIWIHYTLDGHCQYKSLLAFVLLSHFCNTVNYKYSTSSPFLFINYLLCFFCVWSTAQTFIFSNVTPDRYLGVETVIKTLSNGGCHPFQIKQRMYINLVSKCKCVSSLYLS